MRIEKERIWQGKSNSARTRRKSGLKAMDTKGKFWSVKEEDGKEFDQKMVQKRTVGTGEEEATEGRTLGERRLKGKLVERRMLRQPCGSVFDCSRFYIRMCLVYTRARARVRVSHRVSSDFRSASLEREDLACLELSIYC